MAALRLCEQGFMSGLCKSGGSALVPGFSIGNGGNRPSKWKKWSVPRKHDATLPLVIFLKFFTTQVSSAQVHGSLTPSEGSSGAWHANEPRPPQNCAKTGSRGQPGESAQRVIPASRTTDSSMASAAKGGGRQREAFVGSIATS